MPDNKTVKVFRVEVQVTHTRTYSAIAFGPEEALRVYHNGQAEFDNDDMDVLATWDEDPSTAKVYAEDDDRVDLRIDANGYAIDMHKRGLRLCMHCNRVMSEGFSTDGGDVYACDEICLTSLGWEQNTQDEIDDDDDGSACYWTDWEGDESHDNALERLVSAPYNYSEAEIDAAFGH